MVSKEHWYFGYLLVRRKVVEVLGYATHVLELDPVYDSQIGLARQFFEIVSPTQEIYQILPWCVSRVLCSRVLLVVCSFLTVHPEPYPVIVYYTFRVLVHWCSKLLTALSRIWSRTSTTME